MRTITSLRTRVQRAGWIVLVSAWVGTTAFGANENYMNFVNRPDFTTNTLLEVEDSRYDYMVANPSTWPNEFANQTVSNRVILSVNHEDANTSLNVFNASVDVVITVFDQSGSSSVINKTLTVNKTAAMDYLDQTIFEIPNPGYRLQVSIQSKNASEAALYADYNLQVRAEIEIERYDLFTPTTIPSGISSTLLSGSGELQVKWPVVPGAEHYELEWAHYYSKTGSPLPAFHPDELRTNSTRITTTGLSYTIPLLYDPGYLVYRVRALGRIAANSYASEIPGRWSMDASLASCNVSNPTVGCLTTDQYYYHAGHETALNWQSSVTYAEGGKRKEAIGYYDGTLRNRQSQSKIESDQRVVIGEIIYDYVGRPAIQVLSVPVLSEKIEHRSNFNQNTSLTDFHASDFDADPAVGGCPPQAPAMSTQSGASRYYSANGFIDFGIAQVPDAEGYPYVQTIYTPDNTSRIKSASGEGESHAMGSDHETEVFYGKPFQEELDMLFASEAGYSEFYQKIMERDPNGQITVTYTDLAGNLVATGLEGAVPSNMVALDGATTFNLQVDLLNKKATSDFSGASNHLSEDGRSLEVNTSFLISTPSEVTFTYQVDGTTYSENCSVQKWKQVPLSESTFDTIFVTEEDSFCYECIYDLTLSLIDECGDEFLWRKQSASDPIHTTSTVGQSVLDLLNNDTYETDGTCHNPQPPAFNTATDLVFPDAGLMANNGIEEVALPIGSYTLNKTLTVNPTAVDRYTQEYLEHNSCLLDLQHFEIEAFLAMDLTGCGQTCQECRDAVDALALAEGYTTPQKDALLAKCDEMCDVGSVTCTSAYQSLLTDVSPNGQYGRVSGGSGVNGGQVVNGNQLAFGSANPAPYPLSVFNLINFLPRKNLYVTQSVHPNWRNPLIRVDASTYVKRYEDAFGNPAYVPLEEVSPGVYEPAISGSPVMIGGEPYAHPEDLVNLDDFLDYWESSWAKSLVIYHPEYLYYIECLDRSASHDHDYGILTNAFTEVQTADWNVVPSSMVNSDVLATDPYFTASAPEKQAMAYFMENFSLRPPMSSPTHYSIYEAARIIANTPAAGVFSNCANPTPSSTGSLTEAEWEIFRSLYISLKQKFLNYRDQLTAVNSGFYNGCIGTDAFDPFRYNFFAHPLNAGANNAVLTLYGITTWPTVSNTQFYSVEQPCNFATFDLYKNKVARFGSVTQYLGTDDLESGGCDYDPSTTPGVYAHLHKTCQNYVESYSDELQGQSAATFLRECGVCPFAKDLELFLTALIDPDPAQNQLLTSTGTAQVSCLAAGNEYSVYTPALDEAIFGTNDPSNHTTWTGGSSATGTLVTGTLTKGTSSATVQLQFIGANTGNYKVQDILSFCCVSLAGNSTSFSFTQGSNFTVEATVDAGGGTTEQVLMEGLVEKSIGGAPLVPQSLLSCEPESRQCQPTEVAKHMQRLFNGLLYDNGGSITQQLFNGNVNLSAGVYRHLLSDGLYEAMHRVLGSGLTDLTQGTLQWTSSLAGSTVTAQVANHSGNACQLILNLGSVNPANIQRIFRIEPDPAGPNHFTAQVQINTGATLTYASITGASQCLNFGDCKPYGRETTQDTEPVGDPDCSLTTYGQGLTPANMIPSGALGGSYVSAEVQDGCFLHVQVPSHTGKSLSDVVSYTALQADPEYVEQDGKARHAYFFLRFADGSQLKVRVWSDCYVLATCNLCYFSNLTVNGDFETIGAGNTLTGYTIGSPFTQQTNLYTQAPGSWSNNRYGMINDPLIAASYPLFDHTESPIHQGAYLGFAFSGDNSPAIWEQTIAVEPNKDYVFSAWVGRLTEESEEPSIVLDIGGTPAYTLIIDEGAGTWQQLAYVWNSGSNTSVTLGLLPKTASSGVTQKLGLDDVEFGVNCPRLLPTEELVVNGDFQLGNTLFNSGFPEDCICLEYSYCVGSEPKDKCNNSQWIDDLWDHTLGTSSGKYLIVDGREFDYQDPSFWSMEVPVIKGRSYTFSLWIMPTISVSNTARVQMIVDGAPLGTTIQANGSQWLYFSNDWTADQTATITIELHQINSGGGGNDFGVDDISFKGPRVGTGLICDLKPTPTVDVADPCATSLMNIAQQNAENAYRDYIDDISEEFQQNLIAKCLDVYEKLEMQYTTTTSRQYTLYYYDQSGNMVRTIPPAGVNLITDAPTLTQIKTDRANGTKTVHDSHTKATTYHYNSLNQLVEQTGPDVDNFTGENYATRMWYDPLGRLVVSQTSRQRPLNRYSYARYDDLGWVVESGEIETPAGIQYDVNSILDAQQQVDYSLFEAWLVSMNNQKYEVANTYYNVAPTSIPYSQENLRERIASVTYEEMDDGNPATYDHATHYSYDIHGNVKLLVQDFPALNHLGQRYKDIEYTYDLVSGNVNEVVFQRGEVDQFYHRYTYDADNRIQHVWVSTDGISWDQDARYQYYPHGPLQRTELGQLKVQGQDYAYTIQGWMKGVNSNRLRTAYDPGADGHAQLNNLNADFMEDEMGYSLGYFNEGTDADYTPVGSTNFLADLTGSALRANSRSLYNGRISHTVTSIGEFMRNTEAPFAMRYRYDQLNRLKESHVENYFDATQNQWHATAFPYGDYAVSPVYDKDGNITSLNRKGTTAGGNSLDMDQLTYTYETGRNRLEQVQDAIVSLDYTNDLESQGSKNYAYDAEGNLTRDNAEGIEFIHWTAAGKVKRVLRYEDFTQPDLEFHYDAMGHRIVKIVKPKDPNTAVLLDQSAWLYTYYVRDAQGNVIALYERTWESQGGDLYHERLNLAEQHLYGSGRLGVRNPEQSVALVEFEATVNGTTLELDPTTGFTDILPAGPVDIINHRRGEKSFELKNHLGNVLTVVSDRTVVTGGNVVFEDNFDTFDSWAGLGFLDNNRLRVTTNTQFQAAVRDLPATPNTAYTLKLDVDRGTSNDCMVVIQEMPSGNPLSGITFFFNQTYEASFMTQATTTSIRLRVQRNDPTPDGVKDFYIDNVLLTENDAVYGEEFGTAPIGSNWTFGNSTYTVDGVQRMFITTYNPGDGAELNLTGLDPNKTYRVRAQIQPLASLYDLRFKVWNNGSWILEQPIPLVWGAYWDIPFQINPGTNSATIRLERYVPDPNTPLEFILGEFVVLEGEPIQIDYEKAEVLAANDYYPFGMQMPERSFNGPNYRYGFGSHEKDSEIESGGNYYDMGMRLYDTRIGRTPSIDPKSRLFPSLSPYSYAGNDPLYYVDPDGAVIEPYFRTWGYGWFSWKTYPHFTGGITGTHGETFHKVKTRMIQSSDIFSMVYEQLENSTNHFRFTEKDITQGGVKGAMDKHNPEANGYFEPGHEGTEEDPFVINFNYDLIKGISGYKSTSTIFEETFHAGQTDYYGVNNKPSGIDIEVEAKIVKAIEGYNDEFTYEGFEEFRTAFKEGKASNQQLLTFELQVFNYAEGISETYVNYKMSKGMSKETAERLYGMGAYTGNFKYAEKLYGQKLRSQSVEIIVTPDDEEE